MPAWLRLLLVATPFVLCALVLCIAVYAVDLIGRSQAQAATAVRQETRFAAETATQLESQRRAAGSATAALGTARAADQATATALAAQLLQTLTQAAPGTPSATLPPTVTETQVVVVTPKPKTITLTLRECRGYEGTVIFSAAPPQSLNAFKTIFFTVPPGMYHLRIDWLGRPDANVNTPLDLQKDTLLTFGDQCR